MGQGGLSLPDPVCRLRQQKFNLFKKLVRTKISLHNSSIHRNWLVFFSIFLPLWYYMAHFQVFTVILTWLEKYLYMHLCSFGSNGRLILWNETLTKNQRKTAKNIRAINCEAKQLHRVQLSFECVFLFGIKILLMFEFLPTKKVVQFN